MKNESERQARVGVAVFVFNIEDDSILLMKRRGSHGAGTWGLPGGHIEFGESVVAAAVRELQEEIGLDFNPDSFCRLGWSEAFFLEEGKHYITTLLSTWLTLPRLVFIREPNKCSGLCWASRQHELFTRPYASLFEPLAGYLRHNGLPSTPISSRNTDPTLVLT